jgi:hypothetical protein
MGAGVSVVAVETHVRVDRSDGRLHITESTTPLMFINSSVGRHALNAALPGHLDMEEYLSLSGQRGGGLRGGGGAHTSLLHPASTVSSPLSRRPLRASGMVAGLGFDEHPSPPWARSGGRQDIDMAAFLLDTLELEAELNNHGQPRRRHAEPPEEGAVRRPRGTTDERILRLAEALFSMLDDLVRCWCGEPRWR